MNRPIYLDYNATTPVDPQVLAAMRPYLEEHFGNPSSSHAYGVAARKAVDQARAQVACLIAARPEEIIFTGGGTEANNLAIQGTVWPLLLGASARCLRDTPGAGFWRRLRFQLRGRRGLHLITSAIEHPATLRPCAFLERLGCQVTVLRVDSQGIVDLDQLRRALRRPTTLVSIMHANNEVGVIQPIREIAALAHAQGALVHTDAAQSVGKLPVDVRDLGVDLLSIAGHKVYAPKGVGALYVRSGVELEPVLHGAGHESGLRAGTENVPYLVGLGAACAVAEHGLAAARPRLRALRDRLWQGLKDQLGDRVLLHGHPEQRLPNTLFVSFLGHVGSQLLEAVPEIAASTGSACHEGQVHHSAVLAAMGVRPEIGQGVLRLSVGRFTTEDEVDRAAGLLARAAKSGEPKAPSRIE